MDSQCDQTASVFVQYLAIYNNENFPNRKIVIVGSSNNVTKPDTKAKFLEINLGSKDVRFRQVHWTGA